MVEAPILSMESFPSKQSIKPLICLLKHFLSHRHKPRQHHIPKRPSQRGERGNTKSCRIRHVYREIYLKFCAISIVSAGKYGNLTPYLSFNKRWKMVKRRNQKERICPLLVWKMNNQNVKLMCPLLVRKWFEIRVYIQWSDSYPPHLCVDTRKWG